MMLMLIKNEFFKQKRNLLLLVIILIPLFINLLLFVDYNIRYESYIMDIASTNNLTSWQILIKEQRILYFNELIPLLAALIIGTLMEIEYKNNSWLFLLSKPIKRFKIILSKYITGIIYVFILLCINVFSLISIGKIFKFKEPTPVKYLFIMLILQLLAGIVTMLIHMILSIKNKNVLSSFGIAALVSIISSNLFYNKFILSNFNPYSFALYTYTQSAQEQLIIYLMTIVFIIVLGSGLTIYFNKKKVY